MFEIFFSVLLFKAFFIRGGAMMLFTACCNKQLSRNKGFIIYSERSGVARVSCALGQEIFLRPLSTKTTEFEVKDSCKNLEDAKFVLF